MVDFEQLLNNYIAVEQSGQFNPYKQVYSASFEQNGSNVPMAGENGKKQLKNSVQAYPDDVTIQSSNYPLTSADIAGSFSKRGYEDPLYGIVSDGKVNFSALSTGYNQLIQDPEIGIRKQDYVDYLNKVYKGELESTYYPGVELMIGEDDSLELSKQSEKAPETRFSKSWGTTPEGSKGWIYLEEYEDPMMAREKGKAYKQFKSYEDYNKAFKEKYGYSVEEASEKRKEEKMK